MLTLIYWLLKLHKKAMKGRFLITAPLSCTKPLSKSSTFVFKLFLKKIDNYKKQSHISSRTDSFWNILNNKPVINFIKNRKIHNKASITMF